MSKSRNKLLYPIDHIIEELSDEEFFLLLDEDIDRKLKEKL